MDEKIQTTASIIETTIRDLGAEGYAVAVSLGDNADPERRAVSIRVEALVKIEGHPMLAELQGEALKRARAELNAQIDQFRSAEGRRG